MIRSHDIEPLIKFQRFLVRSDVTSDRMRWLTRSGCSMSGDTIKDGFPVRPGVMMQCCLGEWCGSVLRQEAEFARRLIACRTTRRQGVATVTVRCVVRLVTDAVAWCCSGGRGVQGVGQSNLSVQAGICGAAWTAGGESLPGRPGAGGMADGGPVSGRWEESKSD
jgi:hypothetical protein